MRHTCSDIIAAQQAASDRYTKLREQITTALEMGLEYPWGLLAGLRADKFYSDIVESVIGAIFVDSRGDLKACEAFVERLGLMRVLKRILANCVGCLHPKERLGIVADQERVHYEGGWIEGKVWASQVQVGGRDVGRSVEGVSRIHAETVAALEAVVLLQTEEPGPA